MKSRLMIPFLMIFILLSSCGKSSSDKNPSPLQRERPNTTTPSEEENTPNNTPTSPTDETPPDNPSPPETPEVPQPTETSDAEDASDGIYMAKFETLNPHINGTIPGSVTFNLEGDKLLAYLRLFGGKPQTWHQQAVFLGKRCPDLSDDINKDGFIDYEEAIKVTGKMIIPLDANINSQKAGKNFYPLADLSGNYHYERMASFQSLLEDLRNEDLNLEDDVIKIGPVDKFNFQNKVVMVFGVSSDTVLPETVAAQRNRRAFQSFPITCGIIKLVNTTPGTIYTGEIPGPVAEVEEGQDRPAPPHEEVPQGPENGPEPDPTTDNNETSSGEVSNEGGARSGESGTRRRRNSTRTSPRRTTTGTPSSENLNL